MPQCVAIVSGFIKQDPFRCEVCWHVNLWHYRPSNPNPNPSPNSRIAVAGVWSNLEISGKEVGFVPGWFFSECCLVHIAHGCRICRQGVTVR